jgi:2,4-didehydro-3-deoxy-L-rhamnonate hydrolase
MRLVRFGDVGSEKPGIIDNTGRRLDLSARFEDWNVDFFANDGVIRLEEMVRLNVETLPAVSRGC